MNPKPASKSATLPEASAVAARSDRGIDAEFRDRTERLEYIGQMLIELRAMAAGVDAATLVYLLEISALEADETAKANRLRAELFANG